MKFGTIIATCIVGGAVLVASELNTSMAYALGAYNAFHEIQKNSDVQEVKVKVPFFGKKINFKVSK